MPPRPTIVILGAAVWPGGVPSPTLKRRAEHGARCFLNGRGDAIIASGGVGENPPSQAEIMRDICTAMGVPDSAIRLEDRSTTTLENITFSIPLLRPGHRDVLIVTDAYHTPRARLVAKRLGLNAVTSSPPLRGTKPLNFLKSFLREIPAYLLYLVKTRQR